MSSILVQCEDGVYEVVLDEAGAAQLGSFEAGATLPARARPGDLVPAFALPHILDADASGSALVLLLDLRPPLLLSPDAGETWDEAGRGLPAGRAIAFGGGPEVLAYAARNRVYLSDDGGRFWRALTVELPEIEGIAWA